MNKRQEWINGFRPLTQSDIEYLSKDSKNTYKIGEPMGIGLKCEKIRDNEYFFTCAIVTNDNIDDYTVVFKKTTVKIPYLFEKNKYGIDDISQFLKTRKNIHDK